MRKEGNSNQKEVVTGKEKGNKGVHEGVGEDRMNMMASHQQTHTHIHTQTQTHRHTHLHTHTYIPYVGF